MTGELGGIDLARQALIAAREAAKKNGATQTRKPKRRTTVVRRDGREPLRLGSAIGMMMTERGMVAPAAGGPVLADFDAILTAAVPELAGRVKATAFDVESSRLDVVPDAPACGTKLRWSAPKLVEAANERGRGANRPARPSARTREDRHRHGRRRPGPATGRAGGAPDPAGRLPACPRSTPPGHGAVPGRPRHRGRGGGGPSARGDHHRPDLQGERHLLVLGVDSSANDQEPSTDADIGGPVVRGLSVLPARLPCTM
ncbi:hypothetical protein ACFQ61_09560 [Streptomyces sp. NPDC056500]|uniref:hypothetical protein n=1 Tax=Streptomyces sp. NPDC056500 TaxID=3345840 RepID=UPI0036CBE362